MVGRSNGACVIAAVLFALALAALRSADGATTPAFNYVVTSGTALSLSSKTGLVVDDAGATYTALPWGANPTPVFPGSITYQPITGAAILMASFHPNGTLRAAAQSSNAPLGATACELRDIAIDKTHTTPALLAGGLSAAPQTFPSSRNATVWIVLSCMTVSLDISWPLRAGDDPNLLATQKISIPRDTSASGNQMFLYAFDSEMNAKWIVGSSHVMADMDINSLAVDSVRGRVFGAGRAKPDTATVLTPSFLNHFGTFHMDNTGCQISRTGATNFETFVFMVSTNGTLSSIRCLCPVVSFGGTSGSKAMQLAIDATGQAYVAIDFLSNSGPPTLAFRDSSFNWVNLTYPASDKGQSAIVAFRVSPLPNTALQPVWMWMPDLYNVATQTSRCKGITIDANGNIIFAADPYAAAASSYFVVGGLQFTNTMCGTTPPLNNLQSNPPSGTSATLGTTFFRLRNVAGSSVPPTTADWMIHFCNDGNVNGWNPAYDAATRSYYIMSSNAQSVALEWNRIVHVNASGSVVYPTGCVKPNTGGFVMNTLNQHMSCFHKFDAVSGAPLWSYGFDLTNQTSGNPLNFVTRPLAVAPFGQLLLFGTLTSASGYPERFGGPYYDIGPGPYYLINRAPYGPWINSWNVTFDGATAMYLLSINERCSTQPCMNGGTCSNLPAPSGAGSFACACVPGYAGSRCEIDIHECVSFPCQNGGLCIQKPYGLGYACDCAGTGYTDSNCQTEINECDTEPCEHGGTCTDRVNAFACACVNGFTGARCQWNAPPTPAVNYAFAAGRGSVASPAKAAVAVDAVDTAFTAFGWTAAAGPVFPGTLQYFNSTRSLMIASFFADGRTRALTQSSPVVSVGVSCDLRDIAIDTLHTTPALVASGQSPAPVALRNATVFAVVACSSAQIGADVFWPVHAGEDPNAPATALMSIPTDPTLLSGKQMILIAFDSELNAKWMVGSSQLMHDMDINSLAVDSVRGRVFGAGRAKPDTGSGLIPSFVNHRHEFWMDVTGCKLTRNTGDDNFDTFVFMIPTNGTLDSIRCLCPVISTGGLNGPVARYLALDSAGQAYVAIDLLVGGSAPPVLVYSTFPMINLTWAIAARPQGSIVAFRVPDTPQTALEPIWSWQPENYDPAHQTSQTKGLIVDMSGNLIFTLENPTTAGFLTYQMGGLLFNTAMCGTSAEVGNMQSMPPNTVRGTTFVKLLNVPGSSVRPTTADWLMHFCNDRNNNGFNPAYDPIAHTFYAMSTNAANSGVEYDRMVLLNSTASTIFPTGCLKPYVGGGYGAVGNAGSRMTCFHKFDAGSGAPLWSYGFDFRGNFTVGTPLLGVTRPLAVTTSGQVLLFGLISSVTGVPEQFMGPYYDNRAPYGGWINSWNTTFDGPNALYMLSINELCSHHPCLNGGSCLNMPAPTGNGLVACACVPGFSGTYCQTEINECASQPCANGGTCTDQLNSYTCACLIGYTGSSCATNVNECESYPCMNGAACIDGVNSFSCVCLPRYSGLRCEHNDNQTPALNFAMAPGLNVHLSKRSGILVDAADVTYMAFPSFHPAPAFPGPLSYHQIAVNLNDFATLLATFHANGTIRAITQSTMSSRCDIGDIAIDRLHTSPALVASGQSAPSPADASVFVVFSCLPGQGYDVYWPRVAGEDPNQPAVPTISIPRDITLQGKQMYMIALDSELNAMWMIGSHTDMADMSISGLAVDPINRRLFAAGRALPESGIRPTFVDHLGGLLTDTTCNITRTGYANSETFIFMIQTSGALNTIQCLCPVESYGGSNGAPFVRSLAIDTAGNVYVTIELSTSTTPPTLTYSLYPQLIRMSWGVPDKPQAAILAFRVLGGNLKPLWAWQPESVAPTAQVSIPKGITIDAHGSIILTVEIPPTPVPYTSFKFGTLTFDNTMCGTSAALNNLQAMPPTSVFTIQGTTVIKLKNFIGSPIGPVVADWMVHFCADGNVNGWNPAYDPVADTVYAMSVNGQSTGLEWNRIVRVNSTGFENYPVGCIKPATGTQYASSGLGAQHMACFHKISAFNGAPVWSYGFDVRVFDQTIGVPLDNVIRPLAVTSAGQLMMFGYLFGSIYQVESFGGPYFDLGPSPYYDITRGRDGPWVNSWDVPFQNFAMYFMAINDGCGHGNICLNGGTCSNLPSLTLVSGNYSCACAVGFAGDRCQIDLIDECSSNPCVNGATCVNLVNKFACTCVPGFSGRLCQTAINECASNPCANAGTCTDGVNQFTCACVTGFSGLRCQTNVNECASSPCENAGTCVDLVNRFACTCRPGFSGLLCQTEIDECSSSPCANGGTCRDLPNSFTCTCLPGFSGARCETNVNECASAPCLNAGSCVDAVDSYACVCAPGFSGVFCDTNIDECASQPCVNGGTCADDVDGFVCHCAGTWGGARCQSDIATCASSPCMNNGNCADVSATGWTCVCAGGFTGKQCETNINECASSPCVNGGTCVDLANAFACTCRLGFSGARCETNINECASQPCTNGGTCTDLLSSFTCKCAAGYSGALCQTEVDECSSSPCVNGGTCVDGVGAYSCGCVPGYSGLRCQTNINECASLPCLNGATCVDGLSSFVCNCAPGFTGMQCQTNINDCPIAAVCSNGGTCVDGINSWACACAAGYSGTMCTTDVNECASSPCNNGGTCVDGIAKFTCNCVAGYYGATCAAGHALCGPGACSNGGQCIIAATTFTCNCPTGYTGAICEIPPPPVARFTAPGLVSGCDVLILDASTSLDPSGGVLSYAWGVDGVALSSVRAVGASGSSGDGQFGTFVTADGRVIKFEPFELPALSYNFTLVVTSSGSGAVSALASQLVSTQTGAVPLVSVPFPSQLSRPAANTFVPSLTPSACALPNSVYSYQWSINPALSPPAGQSIAYGTRNLFIPARSWAVGVSYVVTLTVTVTAPAVAPVTVSVSSNPALGVVASSLLVMITGGDRTISIDQSLYLDGSSSLDPDTSSSTGLTYNWSCENETGLACSIGNEFASAASWTPAIRASAALYLPAFGLAVDRTLAFRLCISSPTPSPVGRTSCSVYIFVQTVGVPDFPNPTVQILAPGALIVNPGSTLRLTGNVNSAHSTSFVYQWTDRSSNAIDCTDPAIIDVAPNSPNLVIRGSVFLPGNVYRFRLTATATNRPTGAAGGQSYAEVTVTVNIPPSGGSFSAVPVSPADLVNSQVLSCWGWTTAHPPLSYAFSWFSTDPTQQTPLTSARAETTATVPVPFGTSPPITVLAYITDSLQASTVVAIPVSTSWPPAATNDPSGYAANLTQLLNQQLGSQDTTGSLGVLTILTDLANSNPPGSTGTGTRNTILDSLNHLSTNLTGGDGSVATTIIAILNSATSKPDEVSDDGFETSLDTIRNVLDVLNDLSNNAANDPSHTSGVDNSGVVIDATNIASNFLGINNCTKAFSSVQDLMAQILRLQQIGRVAGESASAIDTQLITAIVQRAYQTGVLLNSTDTSGASVSLPPFSFSSNRSFDISIVNYKNVSRCLTDRKNGPADDRQSGDALLCAGEAPDLNDRAAVFASDVTTAEIVDSNGTVHDISDLPTSQAINFTIPITAGTDPSKVQCTFWNEKTLRWDTAGCTTSYDPSKPDRVQCSCTHLTDFAVLLNERENRDTGSGCVSDRLTQSVSFKVFAALYAFLAVLALIPVARSLYAKGCRTKRQLSLYCHVLVSIICCCRLATMLSYMFADSASFTSVALLAATPYIFVYWLHTFVIFAWASIYYYATQSIGENPFVKVKGFFVVLNISVVAIALTLFGLVAFSPAGTPTSTLSLYSEIGSFLIGTLSMATGVGFIGYGLLLTRNLTQDFASKHATRIFYVACVCSVSFVVESIIVVYSAVQVQQFDDNFEALNSLYLTFDIICMSAVLALFQADSERQSDDDKDASVITRDDKSLFTRKGGSHMEPESTIGRESTLVKGKGGGKPQRSQLRSVNHSRQHAGGSGGGASVVHIREGGGSASKAGAGFKGKFANTLSVPATPGVVARSLLSDSPAQSTPPIHGLRANPFDASASAPSTPQLPPRTPSPAAESDAVALIELPPGLGTPTLSERTISAGAVEMSQQTKDSPARVSHVSSPPSSHSSLPPAAAAYVVPPPKRAFVDDASSSGGSGGLGITATSGGTGGAVLGGNATSGDVHPF